jgi:hypothetical protein
MQIERQAKRWGIDLTRKSYADVCNSELFEEQRQCCLAVWYMLDRNMGGNPTPAAMSKLSLRGLSSPSALRELLWHIRCDDHVCACLLGSQHIRSSQSGATRMCVLASWWPAYT